LFEQVRHRVLRCCHGSRLGPAADAADLAVRRSDPETARFQSWTAPYPIERARALIDEVLVHGEPTAGFWDQFAIDRLEDRRTVGDLAVRLSDDGRTAEIGYTLHAWARGLGYATEAATRLIDYLVESRGVHRIEASTDAANTASIRGFSSGSASRRGDSTPSPPLGTADAIFVNRPSASRVNESDWT
jgi:RimJ/RimL family protein N-acetyltransferase